MSQRIETAASARILDLAPAHGDELGKNRDGNLFGADRADIEADGRVHALQALGRHPLGEERVVNPLHFRLAPDQSEISQVARGERAQRVEVVRMSARHDDDVGIGGKIGAMEPLGNRFDDDLVGVGKPLTIRELLAVVEHVRAESDRVGETRKVIAHMAGADDVEARCRLERLDVDLHLPAADQSVLLREIVVEVVFHERGRPRLN